MQVPQKSFRILNFGSKQGFYRLILRSGLPTERWSSSKLEKLNHRQSEAARTDELEPLDTRTTEHGWTCSKGQSSRVVTPASAARSKRTRTLQLCPARKRRAPRRRALVLHPAPTPVLEFSAPIYLLIPTWLVHLHGTRLSISATRNKWQLEGLWPWFPLLFLEHASRQKNFSCMEY